jgi:hypothetical protein
MISALARKGLDELLEAVGAWLATAAEAVRPARTDV